MNLVCVYYSRAVKTFTIHLFHVETCQANKVTVNTTQVIKRKHKKKKKKDTKNLNFPFVTSLRNIQKKKKTGIETIYLDKTI